MSSPGQHLLCQYRFDPLDRLVNQAQTDAPVSQRFYCRARLATEILGALRYRIFQQGDQLLGQQRSEGVELDTLLLATDRQRSILHTLTANLPPSPVRYSAYGNRHAAGELLSLLSFNGEQPDPVTGHYLLGNGYRAFNPVLMRFISADTLSPFKKGGMNAYAYCLGDPINSIDPDGHSPLIAATVLARWRRFAKSSAAFKTELMQIKQTNTIDLIGMYPTKNSLKPGVSPETAIEARNRIAHLSYLGGNKRNWINKFLNDLADTKREVALVEKMTGVPASHSKKLKLLNYLKGGKHTRVFSTERLWAASRGEFDAQVPLHLRPDKAEAKFYRSEFENYRAIGPIAFSEEAYRIRDIYFE
ncbi:RHS repeat-associated core domain-containing protein [Pseudomonas sp. KK4]|uniref:RHS repeat-associated core domain-containing protein n=1 Tax=Pseudomonas sp. KK4 TaxID=1855729 RepID=UPI00097C6A1F|nr:RHS repeat-associated core domain-containing protein [Pseudomonas sp. KK4]